MKNKETLIKSCKRVKCKRSIPVLLELDQQISLLFKHTLDRLMKIDETNGGILFAGGPRWKRSSGGKKKKEKEISF